MVDAAKLSQLLARLEAYVAVLRDLARVPRSEFLGNRDKVGSAKYHFVVAIEACIDIANHIIASQNFRIPKDNADSFAVLTLVGNAFAGRNCPPNLWGLGRAQVPSPSS